MNEEAHQRETMEYDVLIVGAGPAGLSASIRLKQMAIRENKDISVCVLEKGAEVGAHILSGAVIDPKALNELFPDWKERGAPLKTNVTKDRYIFLGKKIGITIPKILFPSFMHNEGNYIISLGNFCRWLATEAEDLGVEIFPGFPASDLVYDESGSVCGVITGDMGVSKDGSHKDSFEPGVEIRASFTLIAEGARGSLAKKIINKFDLAKGKDYPKFGLGLKELWEILPENHQQGLVEHTVGWPLDNKTGGGGFVYHMDNNLLSIGFVVHLNYSNPYLSPYQEFQNFKTHPKIRSILDGGKRISYGARVISEGGLQSIPKLFFPGGVLTGCSAGMVNVPRIKGTHNAMKSGMLAAEAVFQRMKSGDKSKELNSFEKLWKDSWIYKDLFLVRNAKPLLSRYGTFIGAFLGIIDMWLNLFSIKTPTVSHGKPDHENMRLASESKKINYPKPDGKITFDLLSSVFVSNTNHEEDQPLHLVLKDEKIPIEKNYKNYAEPAQRYCPAGVYEVVEDNLGKQLFVINGQNCLHCKTCDVKDPEQNITWETPEGGGGPNYPNM